MLTLPLFQKTLDSPLCLFLIFVLLHNSKHMSINIFATKVLKLCNTCVINVELQMGGGTLSADNGQSLFRRGVTSLVILALLKREDMYGYQLVQETARISGGKLTTQEGSLYPVLYRLLDQGLISDKRVLVGKRMTRIYYHLEPAGEKRLQELITEYEETTQGVFLIIQAEGEK